MKDMDNNLRDFLKEEGNYEEFSSSANYIKSSSFLKTYLYVLTKKKSENLKVCGIVTEYVSCESSLSSPSGSNSNFNIIKLNCHVWVKLCFFN